MCTVKCKMRESMYSKVYSERSCYGKVYADKLLQKSMPRQAVTEKYTKTSCYRKVYQDKLLRKMYTENQEKLLRKMYQEIQEKLLREMYQEKLLRKSIPRQAVTGKCFKRSYFGKVYGQV